MWPAEFYRSWFGKSRRTHLRKMCCRMSCLVGWEEHRFLTKVLMDLSGLTIMFWTSVRHIVHAKHIVDTLIVNARLWTTPHSWPFDMHAPNDAFWLYVGSIDQTKFFSFTVFKFSCGHPYKLSNSLAKLNPRKFFFSNRVILVWNALLADVVAQSSSAFIFLNFILIAYWIQWYIVYSIAKNEKNINKRN